MTSVRLEVRKGFQGMTSDGWLMTEQAGVETPTLTMMQEQQIT